MFRAGKIIVFIVLAMFSVGLIQAQEESSDVPAPVVQEPSTTTVGDQEFTVLPYGTWVESDTLPEDSACLGASKGAIYLFEGSNGDMVDIQMNWRPIVLGDVTPVNGKFVLVNPETQEILANSEMVFSLDPRIEYLDNFVLPYDGMFAIAIGVTEGEGCLTYELGIKQEVDLYADYEGQFEDAEFVVEMFDNVPMVQVPPGCFILGSDDFERSQNGHEVCFDKPFWIDRYEVTVGQFEQLGGEAENTASYTNPLQPRDRISWYEARDFCALRGGRLPTEVEWEYAGRGPDNLNYPWGNQFVPVALVWKDEAANVTLEDQLSAVGDWIMGAAPRREAQPVGSRPAGVSWVGAYDMSGNLAEWTSTLEAAYPYDPTDGREDQTAAGKRIIRGGYFTARMPESFLLALRSVELPEFTHLTYIGFRCVRDA